MSMTVYRWKDGKREPIKLSIWDAFKGVPNPRPRPPRCNQCGHYHPTYNSPNQLAKSSQAPAAGQPSTNKPPKDKTEADAKAKDDNEHNFTRKEDAKILELKADNTTWAKIAESLGNNRTKGMVQQRYKQLKAIEDAKAAKGEEKGKTKETADKPFEQMSKKEKKAAKAEENRLAGLKKQEEAKAKKDETEKIAALAAEKVTASLPGSQGQTVNAAPAAAQPAATAKLGPMPAAEKQYWMKIASKHFDRTGKRITADQARKNAMNMTGTS